MEKEEKMEIWTSLGKFGQVRTRQQIRKQEEKKRKGNGNLSG